MSSVRSAWFGIEIKDKNNQVGDVTDNVAGQLSLKKTAELLDKLSFTLVSTDEQSVMDLWMDLLRETRYRLARIR